MRISPFLLPLTLATAHPVDPVAIRSQQPDTLSATEAKNHVGSTATVCGVVASARYAAQTRGKPTFLNLEKPYPSQVFTVLIWDDLRGSFPESPESMFANKRICVTGKIELYRGTPEIVIHNAEAIRIQADRQKQPPSSRTAHSGDASAFLWSL